MKKIYLLILILAFYSLEIMASALTDNSYQGVIIGDTAEEALKKLENHRASPDVYDEDDGYCYYLSPTDDRPDAYFMIIEGIVARIDIYDEAAKIKTDRGIGIGSTKEELLAAYENVKISPHPYLGDVGDYLEITLENGNGLIFETHQDIVMSFRLGSYPALGYIEGCA